MFLLLYVPNIDLTVSVGCLANEIKEETTARQISIQIVCIL
jgi:hypothetical protein